MVILGFAIVALVVPLLFMVGAMSHAKTSTQTIASDTAWWYARHGEVRVAPDGYNVDVATDGSVVTVTVTAAVPVIAVLDAGPSVAITSRQIAHISPYRSARG